MKTAFITGATGFDGINLTKLLLAQGWRVNALHRKTSNLKYLKRFDVRLNESAITDKNSLADIAQAHLAAYEKGRTGERYLLGGVEADFKEVFNIIERLMGKKNRKG